MPRPATAPRPRLDRPAGEVLRQAERHAAAGETERAAALFREVLAAQPGNRRAAAGLASARPSMPRARDAEERRRMERLSAAAAAGRLSELLGLAGELAAAHPGSALLWNILGVAASQSDASDAAVAAFRRALSLRPDYAEAWYNLGVAHQAADRRAEAIAAFKSALDHDPARADAWNNIGAILNRAGDHPSALAAFGRAIETAPGMVEAWNNRGLTRKILGDFAGAVADFEAAMTIAPGHVPVYFNVANALKAAGQADGARACWRQILKLDPCHAEAARELAGSVGAEEAAALEPLVARVLAAVPGGSAAELHARYAEAYVAMGRGDRAAAVAALDRAGGLGKALSGYDHAADRAFFDGIRRLFDRPPAPLAAAPHPVTPVFIISMPRSGTSLLETMLARLPGVTGAGELEYLRQAVAEAGAEAALDGDRLARVREGYLSRLAAHVPEGASFVTDKMPLNFRFVGHIATALPEARIVHIRRAPEAVAWSNFRLYFPARGMAFSFDQADVARYVGLYEELMAFWAGRFPGRVVEVGYEALTEAPETEMRRLLGELGLPWDDAVLAPERSARAVGTASALQVRAGIYRGSSEAWRDYAPWLGRMLEALAEGEGRIGQAARRPRARM